MKLIDTHSHINFVDFKDDGNEVIKRSLNNNTELVIVGSEFKTSKRALDYANKYASGVYAAVGLHPIHLEEIVADEGENGSFTTQAEVFNRNQYEKLIYTEKVVAVGEIGLDYYHLKLNSDINKVKEKQKRVFKKQILMARMADLPIIIHCRSAHFDVLQILKDFKDEHKDLVNSNEPWGVVHCFSGDENLAWEYFNLGLMISFNGIITFSKQYDDLIRKMPKDKFMIETDCPFLTPEPYRGKRNEPVLVWYVANKIAEIRNTKIEKIADISTNNAKYFFDI